MKVSVLVVTYNHENFIAQALNSVLAQQVEFDYEVLVSEDRSTDRTRDIVTEFHQRYPDRIRLILSEHNLNSNEVVARGIRAAKGQYVALLDGDDYWTSEHKLQRQVQFLDSHPDCAMCFHNAVVVYEDGSREPRNWTPPQQKEFSTLEDIWMGNFIATCSTMFRQGLFEVPSWYELLSPIGDWPLYIFSAEHGKIGYINEVMGTYRHHPGALYSVFSESRKQEETLRFYRRMNFHMNFRYRRTIAKAIFKYFYGWAKEYEKRGEFGQARRCFRTCFTAYIFTRVTVLKRVLRMGLRLYSPTAFRHRPASPST
jgi:glycosyltransferase involved in cell wall biosynthesis